MPALYTGILAILFYCCAFALQARAMVAPAAMPENRPGKSAGTQLSMLFAALALLAHLSTTWGQLLGVAGFDFSLIPVSVAIFFIINLIVVAGSLRQPLQNLYLLLFPATVAVIAISLWGDEEAAGRPLSAGVGAHILLSITAYSLMTIAALEALFLAYQNRLLHRHHTSRLLRVLPPVETMESLLFGLLASGFVLLTLALASGFLFVEDFMAQHLVHKTVFSLLAWLVYATLLWGRFHLGWRGKIATWWTISGFFVLMLAFWGTKFVLEIMLPAPST